MSAVNFSGNMSVFTKMSLVHFTGLESNLKAETGEKAHYSRRGRNVKIRANKNLLMWVWVLTFYPVYHWKLTSAQCLPLAHWPVEQGRSPWVQCCIPTPLTLHNWGHRGDLLHMSLVWCKSTQLCGPLCADANTSGGRGPFGGAQPQSYWLRRGWAREVENTVPFACFFGGMPLKNLRTCDDAWVLWWFFVVFLFLLFC